MEKRKNCVNCALPYAKKTTWANHEKDFLLRLKEGEKKKEERLKKVKEDEEMKTKPPVRKVFDKTSGKIVEVLPNQTVWNKDTSNDFLERSRLKMEEAEMKKKKLEEDYAEHKRFAFKPKIRGSDKVCALHIILTIVSPRLCDLSASDRLYMYMCVYV